MDKDKKSPKETASTFFAMTKAMVSGNPKPKRKSKAKKKATKK
jgi:hypothetical protein